MALPLGLAALIQVIYLWDVHRTLYHNGDAVYYNVQAKLITQGHWFVNPYDFGLKGVLVPSASHPPLMSLVLAGADEVGATTWTWHMVAMAILFVAAVFVAGLAGRQLAGPRAGVVVATVVAAYPYLWMNPAAVLAENLEVLLAALAMWATVRFWKRPRPWIAGELGVYLGLAILTRSELVLLLLAIAAPALIVTRGLTPRARLGRAAVLALGVLVVVGPWVGRNLTTFHHPELLSSEGGVTLATANCDRTYYGPDIGWWSFACDVAKIPPGADESDVDRVERHDALRYIDAHKGRFVEVVAIRALREWNLYRPVQQAQFDRSDARPAALSEAGMGVFYLLVPFAIVGGVALRRRGVPIFPLVGLVVVATVAAALFFANGRYRSEGDLAVAILAGIGIDALLAHFLKKRRREGVNV